MIIDQLPAISLPVQDTDELPIERGQYTYKATVDDLIGGIKSDVEDLQTDVAAKQDTLVSGTNIKTVNGNDLLGSGDIEITSGGALYFTSVAVAATTGDIATVSNSNITADCVLASITFANPNAITTDVTWTTSSGSLVLNGTCTTATTADIVLVIKNN